MAFDRLHPVTYFLVNDLVFIAAVADRAPLAGVEKLCHLGSSAQLR